MTLDDVFREAPEGRMVFLALDVSSCAGMADIEHVFLPRIRAALESSPARPPVFVMTFDVDVRETRFVHAPYTALQGISRQGAGGTDYDPAVWRARAQRDEACEMGPHLMVFVTDCLGTMAEPPPPSEFRCVWLTPHTEPLIPQPCGEQVTLSVVVPKALREPDAA